MKFSIAIETGTEKTAFGVVVPDLPGCFSAGDTVEEAFDKAREAIEAHIEVLAEDGKDLPETKSLSEWQKDREYKGWTWGIVDVPIERFFGPAEKINITVPGLLLHRIDDAAKASGETRSGFLTAAAIDRIQLAKLRIEMIESGKMSGMVYGLDKANDQAAINKSMVTSLKQAIVRDVHLARKKK